MELNLSVSSIMLLGAIFQTALFVLPIPKALTLTPALAVLLFRLVSTLGVTYGYLANPYLKNAIIGKTAVQLPDLDGKFGEPGSQKIAVLLLGAKSNHPLGTFAEGFGTTSKYMSQMIKELDFESRNETGCKFRAYSIICSRSDKLIVLGQTIFQRKDENGATELLLISYWRSLADVHRYAHGPIHTEAWKWWDSTIKSHNYIGFMHEVYEADRGMYESVYLNFQPTLAGATTILSRNGMMVDGKIGDEWVSPLLEARGKLRTSNGRRGVSDSEKVKDMFKVDIYA